MNATLDFVFAVWTNCPWKIGQHATKIDSDVRELMSQKCAILLDGTIGVGKSTMGRGIASRLSGAFLDGDDFKTKGKPWFCSSLSTCRALLKASNKVLEKENIVLIGRPVRCLDWVYFTRHFQRIGVDTFLIGLTASYENIIKENRDRKFSQPELERMLEMINEGYGTRNYADFYMRTDLAGIEMTLDRLETKLRRLIEIPV